MPQSCLLPLLGLVASAQRVDDRHHHEAAWDHVDRACTVAIDAQKVTLRRTGDAAGPRLCAAELGGAAPRAGAAAVVVAWSQSAGRGRARAAAQRRRVLPADAARALRRRAARGRRPDGPVRARGRGRGGPRRAAPRRRRARRRARARGRGAPGGGGRARGLPRGRRRRRRRRPRRRARGEPPAAVVARRGARAAHALAAFRRGRCDAAAGLGPHARVLAPAPVGGLPALAGGGGAALVRTGGDPCADGACAPFAAEPAGGVASRALAWLRACSWGALFWLAVGACCGVPWVGYCVLFAYHFARFSAKPRAPAADRPKSLSVASTLEAIFT